MDGNLGVLEAGVFEDQDIFIRIRGKNQGLLHRVRIELKPGQFRMCGQESRIVHGSRALKAGGCIGRYIGHGLFRRHRDFPGILRRIQDVFDRIAGDSRFRTVDKGDDVLGVVRAQLYALAGIIRAVACHGDSLLGDRLPRHKVRVGYFLVRRYRVIFFIHIVDGVAQDLLSPVGIDRGVRRNLIVPVIEGASRGGRIPAVEDIAGLGRICPGF